MNNFFSRWIKKVSPKLSRKKNSKWNSHQIKLDLVKLEERLVPAPNLVCPSTTSGAPLGFVAGTNLAFSGALDIELLNTPTPASTGNFTTTINATAGTASATASGAATVTGSGTNSLTIAGNLADVNATLNSLTYTNSTAGAASLVVTASDSAGTPLTDSKTIYVNAASLATAPTITTALADVNYLSETASTPVARATIPVVVTDPQGTAGLTVTTTNDNPSLINGITVAGTTPNFTLAITTKTGITGTAVVTVKVSDGTNFTTKSFKVIVDPWQSTAPYWGVFAGRDNNTTARGFADGTGTSASFTNPNGLVSDASANLYVQDTNLIRRISSSGVVTTLAGSTTTTTRVDGVGAAAGIVADFNNKRMIVSPDGNTLYFLNGGYLRKLDINPSSPDYRKVTTLSGGGASGASDVNGTLAQATFPYSTTANVYGGLAISADGNTLYVAEIGQDGMRKVDLSAGTVSKLTLDGSTTYSLQATSIGEYTTGKIFFVTNGTGTTTAYQNGVFALDLTTGTTTKLFNPSTIGLFSNYSVYAWNSSKGYFGAFVQGQFFQINTSGTVLSTQGVTNSGWGYTVGYSPSFGSSATGRAGLVATADGNFALAQGWDSAAAGGNANIRGVTPQPSIYNPGPRDTPMNTPIVFDNAALEKLGAQANFTPVGAGNYMPVTYTLSVGYGTLSFSGVAVPSGLTVTGVGTRTVTITGKDSDINAYMANFTYTPDNNYVNANSTGGALASGAVSPDVLSMSASTNFGTASGSLNLTVRATNNTPRILTNIADQAYITETTVSTETAISFTIADADTATFTSNVTTGARITATSDNPGLISAADIAAAIGGTGNTRTITIKHQPNVTGVANVTITINDGTNQSTKSFKVTVVPQLNYYWDILAGSGGQGTTDGPGTSATFWTPDPITMDTAGNLFVGDASGLKIRKINSVTGQVTTVAGSGASAYFGAETNSANPLTATFGRFTGLAVDSSNNIYVGEIYEPVTTQKRYRIRKVAYNSGTSSYGAVTTLYDTGSTITETWGIRLSPDQSTLYICFYHGIAKIDLSTNQFSILTGSLTSQGTADGTGTAATFSGPKGIAIDQNGNIIVSDRQGQTTRQVTPAGVVTTLFPNVALTGGSDARLIQLRNGYYLRGDTGNKLQQLAGGDGTTFAGGGGNLVGLNTNVGFNAIGDIVEAPNRNLYLTTQLGNRVHRGTPYPSLLNPGTQSTLMNTRLAFNSADLRQLGGYATAVDANNNPLAISLSFSAQYGTLGFNGVAVPSGVTVTGDGTKTVTISGPEATVNAYLLNFGYTPNLGYLNANMTGGALATGAVAPDVLSLSITTANNASNPITGSLNLLVMAPDNAPRIVTTLPNKTYLVEATVSTETAINFTIADADTSTFTNNATTGARIVATSDNPNLISAADIAAAIGGTGNARTFTVKHQPNITGTANITITINDGTNQNTYTFKVTVAPKPSYYWGILAGSGGASSTDGTGTGASFNAPESIARDSAGFLYVGDAAGRKIRKINSTTGQVITIAGSGADGSTGVNGYTNNANPLLATFGGLTGIAVDSAGNIYVSENYSPATSQVQFRIRKIAYSNGAYGPVTTLYDTNPQNTASQGIQLTPDQTGLYVAFVNGVGRLDFSNNQFTILAGSPATSGSADGTGAAATFSVPQQISMDLNGNLLLPDDVGRKIRQVTPQGVTTTILQDLSVAVTGTNTSIIQLRNGYYLRGDGIYKLVLNGYGDSAALAGTGSAAETVGLDSVAAFNNIREVIEAPNGTLYLTTYSGNRVRVGTPYPTLLNPGAQSTNEATRLAFSNADLQKLGANANGYNAAGTALLPITLTFSAQYGTLDFQQCGCAKWCDGDRCGHQERDADRA